MNKLLIASAQAWLKARVVWSNLRNRANMKNCAVIDNVQSFPSLESCAKQYYKTSFTYKLDGPSDLFDSMRFPAQCYYDMLHGGLKDDCDGWHAAMYHIANSSKFDCYLLTYITTDIKNSHTVLVIKSLGGLWYKLDYDRLTIAKSLKETMTRKDIVAYNLVKFDYKNSKYYVVEEA